MADSNVQLQWTDEQWNKVRQVVYEEARKARVAGNFLPLYGPLDPDATYVSKETLSYEMAPPGTRALERVSVNNSETQPLLTLDVLVYLRAAQVADSELVSAVAAFRRAANVLARLEDVVIFRGNPSEENLTKARDAKAKGKTVTDPAAEQLLRLHDIWSISAEPADGLLPQAAPLTRKRAKPGDPAGTLVSNVSGAISQLEEKGHFGPFACVLGDELFLTAQTPNDNSLVLPQDRILPFLGGGPLLRTSILPAEMGLVVASGGAPIDLVVATDISVKFLQVTLEPRFVFRVYEKIALRIKEREALVRIP